MPLGKREGIFLFLQEIGLCNLCENQRKKMDNLSKILFSIDFSPFFLYYIIV